MVDPLRAVKIHPAAELFPLMEGKDFDDLCESIEHNGQIEPIIYLDDKLLDGRNRWLACKKTGKKPKVIKKTLKEIVDPVAYVIAKNIARRHMTVQQRAMVAAAAIDVFRQLAIDRQASARQKSKRGRPPGKTRKSPDEIGVGKIAHTNSVRARDQAAEAVGVSGRSVEKANKVSDFGSKEVAKAVRDEQLGLDLAVQLVTTIRNKKEQNRLLKQGSVGIRTGIQAALRSRTAMPDDPLRHEKIARQKAINTIDASTRAVDDYNRLVSNSRHKQVVKLLQEAGDLIWAVK